MKKGKAYIVTVAIDCPYCGGDCCDEDGSLNVIWNSGAPLTCIECGKKCERPKKAE